MKAQPPRNRTTQNRDLYHSQIPEVSTTGEPPRRVLINQRCEVLFLPHTSPRTLQPGHEAGTTAPHVLDKVLWHPVYLIIAAPNEEGDP